MVDNKKINWYVAHTRVNQELWIKKKLDELGISQGDRTDDEMVDFINGYEYENEDTYYYINKFTFS